MTDFNNNGKFVPQTPKTYTVSELRDTQQVKHSALSPAARSKVINRSGSNYVSENQGGYGPCFKSECNCNFKITATLVDRNGNRRSEMRRPTSYGQAIDMANDINFGQGEWEVNGGPSSYDIFNPLPSTRSKLAAEVELAAFDCGPQNITAVENPNDGGVSVNINGARKTS